MRSRSRRTGGRPQPVWEGHLSTRDGLVVASYGRHCVVEHSSLEHTTPENGLQRTICHPRGKKSTVVVGDNVQWLPSKDEGTVESIVTRRNLLYRQDEIRTKAFAANLDQVLILIAAEPEFSEHQLTRALIACEDAGITLIALNKSDLPELFEHAWQRLAPYRAMHYGVLPLSLKQSGEVDKAHLLGKLRGKTTLILGPSGSGKSTLINLLCPGARVLTNEISQALNSGKHTTTSTTLYWVEPGTALIDSPGFQEFGLHHIKPMQLAQLMPDIKAQSSNCKFYNCTHLHEPGCGVLTSIKSEENSQCQREIALSRYRIYSELFAELSAPPKY
jgi:ribosome biogenesis GTPase / thiamine phosphate phosphatase